MLVLFVGEQASTLASRENPYPSLDDWWQVINQSEVRVVLNAEILESECLQESDKSENSGKSVKTQNRSNFGYQ